MKGGGGHVDGRGWQECVLDMASVQSKADGQLTPPAVDWGTLSLFWKNSLTAWEILVAEWSMVEVRQPWDTATKLKVPCFCLHTVNRHSESSQKEAVFVRLPQSTSLLLVIIYFMLKSVPVSFEQKHFLDSLNRPVLTSVWSEQNSFLWYHWNKHEGTNTHWSIFSNGIPLKLMLFNTSCGPAELRNFQFEKVWNLEFLPKKKHSKQKKKETEKESVT